MGIKNEKKPAWFNLRVPDVLCGSAVAADYKIDKEGQHAFVNSASSTLAIAGYTAPLKISTDFYL